MIAGRESARNTVRNRFVRARVGHILKKTFCTSSLCKDYRVGNIRELLLEIKVNVFTADVTR